MSNKFAEMKIVNSYAEAFFQLALNLFIETDDTSLFYNLVFEMQDLLRLLAKAPELKTFLENPSTPKALKKDLLEKCLNRELSPTTMNFLLHLVDKKRINLIEKIAREFLKRTYEFLCIRFVDVWSVVKLTPEQEKVLKNKIKLIIGPIFTEPSIQYAHIILRLKIDEQLLGGFVIKIGSKVIDHSVLGELRKLAKDLNTLF